MPHRNLLKKSSSAAPVAPAPAPAPSPAEVQLHRNAHGRLVLTMPGYIPQSGVLPVRAFPLAAPSEGLSLMGRSGNELLWVEHLDDLPAPVRSLIEEELAVREFAPVILRIHSVSGFSVPSTWQIDTDRGAAQLVLKAEEDIRRLQGRTTLLIAAADGVSYRVPDSAALDKHSRRLLERFL